MYKADEPTRRCSDQVPHDPGNRCRGSGSARSGSRHCGGGLDVWTHASVAIQASGKPIRRANGKMGFELTRGMRSYR